MARLNALDPEGEPLTYGLMGEEAERYFDVESDSGVVWLRHPLDREVREREGGGKGERKRGSDV